MKLYFLLMLILLSGCSNPPENKFEILWPKAGDPSTYDFLEVELPNLVDVNKLEGVNFTFKGGQNYYFDEIADTIKDAQSFREIQEKVQKILGSKDIYLDFLYRDGAYRANTFESLLMVSAYYALEKIRNDSMVYFDLRNSEAFSTHLNVGIFPGSYLSRSLLAPKHTNDNAFYSGLSDTIAFLGVGDPSGLPLVLNVGVVAHEYFHRVFQKEVWENKNYQLFSIENNNEVTSAEKKRALNLIKGTNEGLADINAIAFTGNLSFLNISLTGPYEQQTKKQRDLIDKFANEATYDNLAQDSLDKDLRNLCKGNSENFKGENFSYYCIGTVLAKTLYEASEENIIVLRSEITPLIKHGLHNIAKNISDKKKIDYDMDIFLEPMAKNASALIKPLLCAAFRKRFLSLMPKVSSCTNI